MLRMSKKVEYGLMALLHMDSRRGEALVAAHEIAETYRIPAELLGKVLQALARHDLAESVKGARGGYRLARPLERINLGQVVEALEKPIRIAECCDGTAACRQEPTCNIRRPMHRIQESLQVYIYGLSLAMFRAREEPRRLELAMKA